MGSLAIGALQVDRVVELTTPLATPEQMFPDLDRAEFARHLPWLRQGHYDEASDMLQLSIHSWVLRTGRRTILIDACCGNDKQRPKFPVAHQLATPYLDRLSAVGLRPEDVDVVLCTHLHVDHVGWNTRLDNGRWVPTFPNARYLFSKADYDHFVAVTAAAPDKPANHGSFDDSVLPVVAAGQADMVEAGATQELEDKVFIEPAPGHTPGSMTLSVESRGDRGLFAGDALHHPLQVWNPHWSSRFCVDPIKSAETRTGLMERCAESGALLLPAHFNAPHVCHVRCEGGKFRPEWDVAPGF